MLEPPLIFDFTQNILINENLTFFNKKNQFPKPFILNSLDDVLVPYEA
jgi:hypothetical protein